MIVRLLLITSIVVCSSAHLSAQDDQIQWLSWEEAVERSAVKKKKIFVDIFTKWCGWCKKMDKSTFKDSTIVRIINEHYYAVKFDAEHRNKITINEEVYEYVGGSKAGYNMLAAKLTGGRMGYPTIAFMDENFNLLQPVPGFRKPAELEMLLHYFNGEDYKTTPWKSFARTFKHSRKRINTKDQVKKPKARIVKYNN